MHELKFNIYVFQFSDGKFWTGDYWGSTSDISKAKFYGTIGKAKSSFSAHKHSALWQEARILKLEVQPSETK